MVKQLRLKFGHTTERNTSELNLGLEYIIKYCNTHEIAHRIMNNVLAK